MKRDRLFILGADGFGREMLWLARQIPDSARSWDIAGFLDDERDSAIARLAAHHVDVPYVGTIKDHFPLPTDRFIAAIGGPVGRMHVGALLSARGGRFLSLIDPLALVHPSAALGRGLIMGSLSVVGPRCVLGDFVVLNPSASIQLGVIVDDGCFVGARCEVMEGAHLERGAFLGSHATIHPGVRVGAFAKVGIGAVVLRDVPPGETVFGIPARPLPQAT